MSPEFDYLFDRMEAERQAAGAASCPQAAAAHADLANRYEAVLRAYDPAELARRRSRIASLDRQHAR